MKLVIDFETVDPYLDRLGAGWVHGQIKVLGAAVFREDWDRVHYLTKKEDILTLVNGCSTLIAHNLQYDVGILLMWGVDITKFKLIDTMILAKLYNNIQRSYSLDDLSAKYLNEKKEKDELAEAVIEHNLYTTKTGTSQKISCMKKAHKFAITNLDKLTKVVPHIVASYAKKDVDLTWRLYGYFMALIQDKSWIDKCSHIYRILLLQRQKGVRIDLKRVQEVRDLLYYRERSILQQLRFKADDPEFNPLSTGHVSELLYRYKVPFPFTAKGNPSVTKKFLEAQNHPVCRLLIDYRRYNKARRDFCDSVLECQELLPYGKKGRVYPEFRLFGARTGRFSCANPNIQQIPKRDEEIGPLIRSIYIADEGDQWYSLDFSQQEFRLFAYFAEISGKDASTAVAFREDPMKDFHDFVADLCCITRDQAKPINLGSLYGMGVDKMALELKIPVEDAITLLKRYHGNFTAVRKLTRACGKLLKKSGYVITLGGRKSYLDPPAYADELVGYQDKMIKGRKYKVPIYEKKLVTFEYKGLNKLIQGSAADQIIESMILIDKLGINMLFSVHDEINLSLNNPKDAERVKEIMENCVKLTVPMVTEIKCGDSWNIKED